MKFLKSELDNVADSNKAAAMLQAVALTDEQAYDMQRILSHVENVDKLRYTEAAYKEACKQRAAKTVDAIWKTKTGVMAQSSFTEKEFVFFGIPWEEGWSAYIDGEPVKLEKVNVGFMGLVVPEGTHEIELRYRTPGLTAGAIGTFGGAAALLLYWLIGRRWDQKQKNRKQALPLEKEKENEQDQDAAEPV